MCEFTNAALEEVDKGIILANNFNSSVTWQDNAKRVKGTYLFNFWNETI